jgi:hypothetical protein
VSAETRPPHYHLVRLAKAQPIRGIVVKWVRDRTRDWVAQDFSVHLGADQQWRTVLEQRGNCRATTVIQLDPPVQADQVRIEIARGSPSRPRLAAINEVEVLAICPK